MIGKLQYNSNGSALQGITKENISVDTSRLNHTYKKEYYAWRNKWW